jgi:hypothetical protein
MKIFWKSVSLVLLIFALPYLQANAASLTVTLGHDPVVVQKGQWRIKNLGGPWLNSGDNINLSIGYKTIEFNDSVTNYRAPREANVWVGVEDTTTAFYYVDIRTFEIDSPEKGCPMAHCDPKMSDRINMRIPSSIPRNEPPLQHHYLSTLDPRGALWGLGCVSNGDSAACAVTATDNNIQVFNHTDGALKFTSGDKLNSWVWTSAPIIDTHGSVIAADSKKIIRWDPNGNIVWETDLPDPRTDDDHPIAYRLNDYLLFDGGLPMGIVAVGNYVVLPRIAGALTIVDQNTGEIKDEQYIVKRALESYEDEFEYGNYKLELADSIENRSEIYFTTKNTPPVLKIDGENRARMFLSCEAVKANGRALSDEESAAAMVAIDLDLSNGQLYYAWNFKYDPPSGASPLLIKFADTSSTHQKYGLYFDGNEVVTKVVDGETIDRAHPRIFGLMVDGHRNNVSRTPKQGWGMYEIDADKIDIPEWLPDRLKSSEQYIVASFAENPGGGFWGFLLFERDVYLYDTLHFEATCLANEYDCQLERKTVNIDGNDYTVGVNITNITQDDSDEDYRLDKDHHFVGGPTTTAVYGDQNKPVMLLPAAWIDLNPLSEGHQFLLAVDISDLETLAIYKHKLFGNEKAASPVVWQYNIGQGPITLNTQGQYAITADSKGNNSHIVFATTANGIIMLGDGLDHD